MLRRLIRGLLVSLAITVALAPVVRAQTPPTTPSLTGETLTGTVPEFEARCNPDGSGTIFWAASGAATGPYTGSFREIGIAFISGTAPNFTYRVFVGFTINSNVPPAGIFGSKQITVPGVPVTCQVSSSRPFFVQRVPYQATIRAHDETYHDAGVSNFIVTRPGTGLPNGSFSEDFTSTVGATLLPGGDSGGSTTTPESNSTGSSVPFAFPLNNE